jgi:hypothetical protein
VRVNGSVALTVLLVGSLSTTAGCSAHARQKQSPAPTPGLSSSAPVRGSGTATVTVASARTVFDVRCVRSGKVTQATGNEGSNATTLTVAGSPISAVLVSHGPDGSTSIYQAIAGLRDDAGKPVGQMTVAVNGDSYSGTGVFVLTKIDRSGKRVASTGQPAQTGSFQLTCSGYGVPTK